MGIFSDLLTNAKTIDINPPTTALDRNAIRTFQRWVDDGDVDYPSVVAQTDELQVIRQFTSDPTGGTFTLTFVLASGETFTTNGITYNANAATIETAIDSAATFDVDEVQSIAVHEGNVSGGTFTLTLRLATAPTFTTAPILHDAIAATIQTAIDVAATTAGVPGWINGDIDVSGGDLDSVPVVLNYDGDSVNGTNQGQVIINDSLTGGGTVGAVTTTIQGRPPIVGWTNGDISVSGTTLLGAGGDIVLTYDGTSVSATNQGQATIDGTGLTGGSLDSPAESTTTQGQTDRAAWGALLAMDFVASADIPVQGVDASSFVTVINPGNPKYPSEATIRALADEVAYNDNNVTSKVEILAAAGLLN